MKTIAHYFDNSVICEDCFTYWQDRLTMNREPGDAQALAGLIMRSEPATFEALPDGFTCADCGTTVMP